MHINKEEKRRINDRYFHEHKVIRKVPRIVGRSSHDLTPLLEEQRIELARKYIPDLKEHIKQEKGYTKSMEALLSRRWSC
ncbi:hypothetical protein BH18THE2_BH18THE2_20800 [soil metagenome]